MDKEEIDNIKKAGKISQEIKAYARDLVKPGMKLIDLANAIDNKIHQLGAKPAFPVNLSINEVAAHSTPAYNDETIASGLLKIDIGIHIDGYVADTAFTVDMDNLEENRRLIDAAEAGLNSALQVAKKGVFLGEIGKAISQAIESKGFIPIINLSGHEIKRYDLHAGLTIPNYDNGSDIELEEGQYAIEPFATNGQGKVKDGKPSGIYRLIKAGNARDNFTREVVNYIAEEYNTLPFCSRWIHKKFGARGMLALRQAEQAGLLHQYDQLVETAKGKVAQAEHTILIHGKEKIITTKA